MGWVKEANKLGKYNGTLYGFRIYCIKESGYTENIIIRNGEQWLRTDFHPGHYIAIDKLGRRIETKKGKVFIYESIDLQHLKDYYSK